MLNNKRPPVFLDLTRIRQPVTAVISIGHRISGVLMVLCIPALIYLLDRSLSGPGGYQAVIALADVAAFRAFGVLLIWALAHHIFAGVRLLLLDIHVGVERAAARRSAAWVSIASLAALGAALLAVLL